MNLQAWLPFRRWSFPNDHANKFALAGFENLHAFAAMSARTAFASSEPSKYRTAFSASTGYTARVQDVQQWTPFG
jgi:hypothetical protein